MKNVLIWISIWAGFSLATGCSEAPSGVSSSVVSQAPAAVAAETKTGGEVSPRAAAVAVKESTPEESPEPAKVKALPRLVDLGADKCIPCKEMAPILASLREEYRGVVTVDFIDVWKHPEAGQAFGIRLIPTQIFYDTSGREVYRHVGFLSREEILKQFKEMGVAAPVQEATATE